MLVSALDLDSSVPEGRYLLAQLLRYLVSVAFAPQLSLSEDALAMIVSATSLP